MDNLKKLLSYAMNNLQKFFAYTMDAKILAYMMDGKKILGLLLCFDDFTTRNL